MGIEAFNSAAFQSKLQSLREEIHSESTQFVAAKRDAAMVAQKVVLRKHGFSENFAGVAEMMTSLASHLAIAESLSQQEATRKSKGLIVGMASSQASGWSWPELTTERCIESKADGKHGSLGKMQECDAAASTVDTLPGHASDDDDAVSTLSPTSEDDALYI